MPVPVPSAFDIDAEPLVEIEINDWWFSVLQGFFGEALDEANWDGDDSDFDNIQQAVVEIMALGSDIGGPEMQIKVGSYTGNDSNPQAITGVGFLPVFVIVWMRNDSDANRGVAVRATGDTNAVTFNPGDMRYKDDIVSLDADGFSVRNEGGSSEFKGNEDTRVYTYVAFGE